MLKRSLTALMALVIILSVCGCNENKENESISNIHTSSEEAASLSEEPSAAEISEESEVSEEESEISEEESAYDHLSEGHIFGEWKVTKASTCLSEGEEKRSCSVCGENETKIIPKSDHTAKTVPGIKVTCDKDGSTDGSVCSVCGVVLKASEVVKSEYMHNFDTQSENSLWQCSACGVEVNKVSKLEDAVYYYIAGDKLVIYGTGAIRGARYYEGFGEIKPFDSDSFSDIKHIVIGDGITSIGDKAFSSQYLKNVETLEIGNGVKSIGWANFSHMTVETLRLGNSMRECAAGALPQVTGDMYIPKSLKSVFSLPTYYAVKLHYAGSEEEFMNIQIADCYTNVMISMKKYIETGYFLPEVIYEE